MLIATLPAVHQEELLERIISHPLVGGVRYNTGLRSPYSAQETLQKIIALTTVYNKKLWVDLKNRQLRIVHWAIPNYGKIILNHEIEVDCPCRVYFRGNEWSELKVARGNVIYVDPPPRQAVGEGQAINIHGKNLRIKGFLTEEDKSYLGAAWDLGINDFMLSFVESIDDVNQVREFFGGDVNLALKIESPKGIDLVNSGNYLSPYTLVAARDDLMINIGENKAAMLPALAQIVLRDPQAIVASRIFAGLETAQTVSLGDYADLRLMHLLGYKNFMLSDGISQFYFDEAMKAWEDFSDVFLK
jgi:hypothetical protein